MKKRDLKNMSREELEKKLKELRLTLLKLKAQAKTGASLKNTKEIRNTKRDIARILTMLSQNG